MAEKMIKTKRYDEINRIGRFDEEYLEVRFDDLRSDKFENRQYDEKELKIVHEILEFLKIYKKYRENSVRALIFGSNELALLIHLVLSSNYSIKLNYHDPPFYKYNFQAHTNTIHICKDDLTDLQILTYILDTKPQACFIHSHISTDTKADLNKSSHIPIQYCPINL